MLICNGFSDSVSSARFSAFTGLAKVRSKQSTSSRLRVNALSRAISAHDPTSRENFGTESGQVCPFRGKLQKDKTSSYFADTRHVWRRQQLIKFLVKWCFCGTCGFQINALILTGFANEDRRT